MARRLVFNAKDVVGFAPSEYEDTFVSRLLVDRGGVGSQALIVNHFTLKPGKKTGESPHPEPYDEVYYVLRGTGVVRLGDDLEPFDVEPNTVVFIPGGTKHSLENPTDEDLEILTIMPQQPVEGVNSIYDERKRVWGTTFKIVGDE